MSSKDTSYTNIDVLPGHARGVRNAASKRQRRGKTPGWQPRKTSRRRKKSAGRGRGCLIASLRLDRLLPLTIRQNLRSLMHPSALTNVAATLVFYVSDLALTNLTDLK